MAEEEFKTYQPRWEERKASKRKHRHHHHYDSSSSDRLTNGWGGWMKMRDKQAYYGLMFVVLWLYSITSVVRYLIAAVFIAVALAFLYKHRALIKSFIKR